jgi:hypothetical protein
VGKGVSKNSSDRSKNEPFNDRSKSGPFNDRSKNEPILKGKEEKREKKTTTTEDSPEINPPSPKQEPSSSSKTFCLKKDEVLKHLPITTQTKFNLQQFSLEILTHAAAKKLPKNIDSVDGYFFSLCMRLEDGSQSMEDTPSSSEAIVDNVKSTVQDMFKEVESPPRHEIRFIKSGYILFKDGIPAFTIGYGEKECLERTGKIIKYLKEQNVTG